MKLIFSLFLAVLFYVAATKTGDGSMGERMNVIIAGMLLFILGFATARIFNKAMISEGE